MRARRALTALLLAAAACGREPAGAPLRPPAAAAEDVLVDGQGVSRIGTKVASGRAWDWDLPEAAGGRLRFDWSAAPAAKGEVSLDIALVEPTGATPRWIARKARAFPGGGGPPAVWSEEVSIPVGPGQRRLRISAEPAASLFLSDVRLVSRHDAPEAVVLLLFDTTRRDAVAFGGCVDPSSPRLDAILGGAWKAKRAYAPASWTIPSVASMLTGRVPAALEDADGSPLGIVPGIPTLADDFRRAGWSTAAFLANPTLTASAGFATGFTTFFTTPHEGSSITLPGGETLRRAAPWIASRRGEPFLLFLLLMDPHDPYTPPDRPRGSTPFDPGYRGAYVGDEVNRLQLHEPPAPSAADVRHLEALYHDEVRYADAEIGRFWDRLPRKEQDRVTLVFTSDHGEDFGRHGGWKHGPTLSEAVLRVPLAIRPSRERRPPPIADDALVSLLDLLPTLEGLAGLPRPERALDGTNLLEPDAAPRERLPAITMLTGGAPRAAVVRRESKLFFFDRLGSTGVPEVGKDPRGYRLARLLPGILPGIARFDLAADPIEDRPLPIDRRTFAPDWRAIEEAITHTRRGLELRFVGTGTFAVRVEGLGRASVIEPFALEEDDRWTRSRSASGSAFQARLDLSDGVDGFRIEDASPGGVRITAETECGQLRLAGARPVELSSGVAREVPRAAIPAGIPDFEAPGPCAGVFLWRAEGRARSRTAAEEEETVKKLRALGYLH